jgi:3-oxoacyl-[acyl-carrier protein] reductase
MECHLVNRVALITGGGRGIGEGIALRLASEGADVVIADQDPATAKEGAAKVQKAGRRALACGVDVASWDQVQAMVSQAIQAFGRIDILVNNAGISPKVDGRKILVHEIDPDQWDQVLAVNLKGAFHCAKAVIPHMIGQKSGRIVSIASISAKTGWAGPAAAHYAASKAGLAALTRFMAYELAPYNILCNALAPGRIETPMRALSNAEENEAMRAQIPLQRFGTIEEVANLVLFLVSDLASYITGEIVDINGGWLID